MKSLGLMALGLAFAIQAAYAQNPVTPFTDSDGVPKREHLIVHLGYSAAVNSNVTGDPCEIENVVDHSRMTCRNWAEKYCPPTLKSENCKRFGEELDRAIQADWLPKLALSF